MILETTAAGHESLLGRTTTGLKLRLTGHDQQSSVLQIDRARCLLGAAPSCAVRLGDDRVQDRRLDPFHCLILQGAERTVIRRISPTMRLNGRDFSDAVLKPGDRLAVGSYEIEVLPPEADSSTDSSSPEPQHWQSEVDRLCRLLAAERAAWQARHDELSAELARTKAEAARLAADVGDHLARHARAQQSLERQQATWAETVARWEQERRAWHAERLLKTAELTSASQRMANLEAELATANDRAHRSAEEANTDAAQLDATRDALQRLEADLALAQEQLDEERRDRQAELGQKAGELTSALERAFRLEADLATANEHIARLTDDAQRQTALYNRTQNTLEQLEDERSQAQAAFDHERTTWQVERDLRSTELSEKSLELAAAAEKSTRLDAELSQANDRIARLTEELNNQTALYHCTQEALQRLEEHRAEARATFEQERTAWQAEQGLRSAELSEKSRKLAAAAEQLTRLQAELSQAQEQVARLGAELSQANENTARLTADTGNQAAVQDRTHDALERLEEQHAQAQAAFEQERTGWQAEQQRQSIDLAAAVERAARLETELQATKSQLSRLAAETNNQTAERDERQAELERLAKELAGLERTLDDERQAWLAERHELQSGVAEAELRTAACERQLADLTTEIQAARRQLADDREQWEQLQTRQPSELEQGRAESDVSLSDDAPPADSAPADRGPTDREPTDRELTDKEESELADNRPEEKQPTQTDDLLSRFAAPAETEIAFQTPPSEAPVSTADLLNRFGLSLHHEAHEPAPFAPIESEVATSTPEVASHADKTSRPAHTDGHHDDKDSIDAYMAQLMARLGKPGYVPPQEERPQVRPIIETAPEPEAVGPLDPAQEVPKLRDPSEMARRALPPELATDLSAMRELANLNARTAIDTHARSTLVKAWLSKALVMLLAMAAAGAESWFAMEGNDLASYFIVPCLMIGIVWGWQYLAMSKRLSSRDASSEPKGGASPAQEATEEAHA